MIGDLRVAEQRCTFAALHGSDFALKRWNGTYSVTVIPFTSCSSVNDPVSIITTKYAVKNKTLKTPPTPQILFETLCFLSFSPPGSAGHLKLYRHSQSSCWGFAYVGQRHQNHAYVQEERFEARAVRNSLKKNKKKNKQFSLLDCRTLLQLYLCHLVSCSALPGIVRRIISVWIICGENLDLKIIHTHGLD